IASAYPVLAGELHVHASCEFAIVKERRNVSFHRRKIDWRSGNSVRNDQGLRRAGDMRVSRGHSIRTDGIQSSYGQVTRERRSQLGQPIRCWRKRRARAGWTAGRANAIEVRREKEPGLVSLDRAAEGAAEAVFDEPWNRIGRSLQIVVRIPVRAGEILKGCAVKIIGTALGHVIDHGARGPAILTLKLSVITLTS